MVVNRNIIRYQQHNVTYLINSHITALLDRVLVDRPKTLYSNNIHVHEY
jgi:hypothetical protein